MCVVGRSLPLNLTDMQMRNRRLRWSYSEEIRRYSLQKCGRKVYETIGIVYLIVWNQSYTSPGTGLSSLIIIVNHILEAGCGQIAGTIDQANRYRIDGLWNVVRRDNIA